MSVVTREWGRLALVLLLAFITRAAFVVAWHHTHDPTQFEFPDSASYWDLGRDIATGAPYAYGMPERRVMRAPGYPLLLAPLFRVLGPDVSPAAARWLGVVLGTTTVGAIYWLARLMFDSRVALIAGVIVAVYPETVATSVFPLSDGPFCLWMVLQLAHFRAVMNFASWKAFVLAAISGAIGGFATLTRPSWLLFSPVFAAAWCTLQRFNRRQIALALVMLAALAAVMTPWWIRSYRITGHFVPTVLWVGPSLYDGLSPAADGSSNMDFVPGFEAELHAADAANPPAPTAPPFEYRFDQKMRDDALGWAEENPGRTLSLAGTKLLRMWNVWPNEPAFRRWWIRTGIATTYVPLMLFAVCGAWKTRRRPLDLLLLLSPALYFSLLHAIFIGSLRYRQPALLLLAILAAVAIESLVARFTAPIPSP